MLSGGGGGEGEGPGPGAGAEEREREAEGLSGGTGVVSSRMGLKRRSRVSLLPPTLMFKRPSSGGVGGWLVGHSDHGKEGSCLGWRCAPVIFASACTSS